ncbi:hypothetical protein SynMITS9220_01799 [Synechococcus sp. MIT S9220]|nr:hypothetical protein SynMITS9220_01799 [Synechococcus sp. MIT S9220]
MEILECDAFDLCLLTSWQVLFPCRSFLFRLTLRRVVLLQ